MNLIESGEAQPSVFPPGNPMFESERRVAAVGAGHVRITVVQ